jgi:dehydrogenase/reductase SDR family protein 12
MQLVRTFDTSASQTHAFDYLASFHRVVHWDASVVAAHKTSPGPVSVGTTFEVDVSFMGRVSRLVYTVTDIDAPHRVRLTGKADVYDVVDDIRFSTTPEGKTRIEYSLAVQFSPFMKPFVPLVAPLVTANVDAAVASLTRALDDRPETITPFPAWLDRCILPGMSRFTKAGYLAGKKRWKGLSADLTGKTIVVTGATSGLGRAATLALADMGANLIAVARDGDKARKLGEDVLALTGRELRFEFADLSSMADTAALARRLLAENIAVDVLINNAGALYNERLVTAEGFEKSFALLLLSPFLLTEMLVPALRKTGSSRVINVSSGGMYTQPVVLDDLDYSRSRYDGPKAYARAKRGLVDMTNLWSKKHPDVVFHSMHPGWADTQAVADALPGFHKVTKPWLRTAEQGADTIVWLAASREAAKGSGQFWLDRRPHVTAIFPGTASSEETIQALYQSLTHLADPWRNA